FRVHLRVRVHLDSVRSQPHHPSAAQTGAIGLSSLRDEFPSDGQLLRQLRGETRPVRDLGHLRLSIRKWFSNRPASSSGRTTTVPVFFVPFSLLEQPAGARTRLPCRLGGFRGRSGRGRGSRVGGGRSDAVLVQKRFHVRMTLGISLQAGHQLVEQRLLVFLKVLEEGEGGSEFLAHHFDLIPQIKIHARAKDQQGQERRDEQQAQTSQLPVHRFHRDRFTRRGGQRSSRISRFGHKLKE